MLESSKEDYSQGLPSLKFNTTDHRNISKFSDSRRINKSKIGLMGSSYRDSVSVLETFKTNKSRKYAKVAMMRNSVI